MTGGPVNILRCVAVCCQFARGVCREVISCLIPQKGGLLNLRQASIQRRTHTAHTKSNESKSAHFESAKAHPIQYGAGLTDGPSVFKAEGGDLISKQVKPERGRERDTPVLARRKGPCQHRHHSWDSPLLPLCLPHSLRLGGGGGQAMHISSSNIVISICVVLLYVP